MTKVLDPQEVALERPATNEEDLIVTVNSRWLVAYDNLSGLSAAMSDAYCRLATGTGLGKRALYTNTDVSYIKAKRPVIMNGIEAIGERPDLLQRTLSLQLSPIRKSQRRTETDLEQAFQEAVPGIFGALLDGVSMALRTWDHVTIPLERMADFTRWAAAAGPALGYTEDQLAMVLAATAKHHAQNVIDSNPVIKLLSGVLGRSGQFEGTAAELLDAVLREARELKDTDNEKYRQVFKKIPHEPASFSKWLDRIAPVLEEAGVYIVSLNRSKKGRVKLIGSAQWVHARKTALEEKRPVEVTLLPVTLRTGTRDSLGGVVTDSGPGAEVEIPEKEEQLF